MNNARNRLLYETYGKICGFIQSPDREFVGVVRNENTVIRTFFLQKTIDVYNAIYCNDDIYFHIYSVVDGFFVSNFAGKIPFAAINLIMPALQHTGTAGEGKSGNRTTIHTLSVDYKGVTGEVAEQETEGEEIKPSEPSAPNTGDNNLIMLYIMLCVMCAASIISMKSYRKSVN